MNIQPVTIQVQKRSGSKYHTSIVGLATDLDLEKIMAHLKKKIQVQWVHFKRPKKWRSHYFDRRPKGKCV